MSSITVGTSNLYSPTVTHSNDAIAYERRGQWGAGCCNVQYSTVQYFFLGATGGPFVHKSDKTIGRTPGDSLAPCSIIHMPEPSLALICSQIRPALLAVNCWPPFAPTYLVFLLWSPDL